MSYALLIWLIGPGVVIESYPSMMDCRVREALITNSNPAAQTTCIWMEEKDV